MSRQVPCSFILLTKIQLWTIAVTVAVSLLAIILLRVTSLGRTVRAIRDSKTLVQVMGVNLSRARFGIFALGSVLAGIAGILSTIDVGINPSVGMPVLSCCQCESHHRGNRHLRGSYCRGITPGILQSLAVWEFTSPNGVMSSHFSLDFIFNLQAARDIWQTGPHRGSAMNYIWHILIMCCIYACSLLHSNIVAGYRD